MTKREYEKYQMIQERISSGQICRQKSADFIREMNSFSSEQLNAVAMIDDDRKYTYRQMFRCWDYYAEVFSAMHMTGEDHARVGILAGISAEALLCFYALNMVGASASMIPIFAAFHIDQFKKTIEEERITDLIVTDAFLTPFIPGDVLPEVLKSLLPEKEAFGLRHVIVIRTPASASSGPCPALMHSSLRYQIYKDIPGVLLMEDLLEKYEAEPIVKDTAGNDPAALIIHTSGSTKGIPKPIPLSDWELNEAVRRFLLMKEFDDLRGTAVTAMPLEPASSYVMIDMVHLPLVFGGTVVITPKGSRDPSFIRALGQHRVNILFVNTLILDFWMMKLPEEARPDLSSLKYIALGGTYLSADGRKRYNAFLKERGSRARIYNGYGLAEAGGACFLSIDDDDGDAIGYPLPGVEVRIFDEEKEQFCKLSDGPSQGGLYLSAASLTKGKIDDTVFYEMDEIEGVPYLCTNDLVRVDEKGLVTCLGRTNKFFVNEDGKRFDAGLVENRIAAQEGIRSCAIVPGYSKILHDTVPWLYVTTDTDRGNRLAIVHAAIVNVFMKEIPEGFMSLPEKVVITSDIPVNPAGKVDSYEITKGNVKGDEYIILPAFVKGKLKDLKLEPFQKGLKRPAFDFKGEKAK